MTMNAPAAARARTSSLDVIGAKLVVPPQRPGTVTRARHVELLRSSESATVVTITAPGGYGKSTLLAQWAAADERPFAWLSLDRRDNDPVVFLSHVAGALDRLAPVGRPLMRALDAPGASVFGTVVPRLGAEINALSFPFVLVLDDIHEIDDQICLDALAMLVRHVSAGSVLVLAGRTAPALPLSRYRLEGSLLELDAGDLALDDIEAKELMRDAGVELSGAEAVELNTHAEGWAAGLYLAALAMLADGGPPDVARFHGTDRFVTDYLRTEFLDSLPAGDLEFLTRTSVLERMCGPLCDALLETFGSAERLEAIERANLLLVPLDRERKWYRYHHLFRDMLRAELERGEPELVDELNLRAAAWSEQDGDDDAAIRHAAAAGDTALVGRLVALFAARAYRTGRSSTVERWFELIDDPLALGAHPGAAILGAQFNALLGRTDRALQWLVSIQPAARRVPAVAQGIASVESMMCVSGVAAMLRDAELGAASDPGRANNSHLVGVALLLAGDNEGADDAFADAVRAATSFESSAVAILSLAERALIALARGDEAAADAFVSDGRGWIEDAGVDGYTANGLLHAAAARCAVRRGDMRGARPDIAAAHLLRPILTDAIPWCSVQVRLELAKVHLALAEREAALLMLAEAREVLRTRPDLGVLGPEVQGLTEQVVAADPVAVAWAASLTVAELRLLPLLTTHLTFREIAERLFVSRNTVKTQAISIYRKLGASSRGEAVRRAVELGLIEG